WRRSSPSPPQRRRGRGRGGHYVIECPSPQPSPHSFLAGRGRKFLVVVSRCAPGQFERNEYIVISETPPYNDNIHERPSPCFHLFGFAFARRPGGSPGAGGGRKRQGRWSPSHANETRRALRRGFRRRRQSLSRRDGGR